ncbi:hypothetical protein [Bacillus testis]|uniref:hypothetical protein n=1 Tax=Bacillus testis TaxID=1622072 RepID=UPI00067F24EC|nr:hypothetical protein [Bacillus testis]
MLRNLPFVSSKAETMDFKAFLKGEQRPMRTGKTPVLNRLKKKRTHKNVGVLYSFIPLNPAMFIDPTFILIAAGVVAVALIEKGLADHGQIAFAEAIYTFLKLALPVVGLVAMYFLINQLSF